MKQETITLKEARNLALNNQMLQGNDVRNTKDQLLDIIDRLGYVQIDTISVVERAHKHILWTRFPQYKNELLDELIDKDRKVFEFWDHAAAYMPMAHFRYTLPRKDMYRKKHKDWGKKNKKLLNCIVDRITKEGPLQSRDFAYPKKRGLWWDWKPAKEGLEYLFHAGILSAKARKSFQKVYDLTERVIPENIDSTFPSEEELSRHIISKTINSIGFASESEITYLRHHSKSSTKKLIEGLIEEGEIAPLGITGLESGKYYTTAGNLSKVHSLNNHKILHILSPFDNLVIQRKRLKSLFGFDYVIECYVPAHKRKFGYFCLPVLYGDRFIGRLDAKADRKSGVLHVIKYFPESGVSITSQIRKKLDAKLLGLARFSGCKTVSSGDV